MWAFQRVAVLTIISLECLALYGDPKSLSEGVPYYPIEISRTLAQPYVLDYTSIGGTIMLGALVADLFTYSLQWNEADGVGWMCSILVSTCGLMLLLAFDDFNYWGVHMVGVVCLIVGAIGAIWNPPYQQWAATYNSKVIPGNYMSCINHPWLSNPITFMTIALYGTLMQLDIRFEWGRLITFYENVLNVWWLNSISILLIIVGVTGAIWTGPNYWFASTINEKVKYNNIIFVCKLWLIRIPMRMIVIALAEQLSFSSFYEHWCKHTGSPWAMSHYYVTNYTTIFKNIMYNGRNACADPQNTLLYFKTAGVLQHIFFYWLLMLAYPSYGETRDSRLQ